MRGNNQLKPARLVPPGKILMRELEERGISQADLADIMDRPAKTINGIIKGTKEITYETAVELGKALETPASFWINLEKNYGLHLLERNKSEERKNKEKEIEMRRRFYELAPIRELLKRGWLKFTDDIEENAKILCQYLGIDSIDTDLTEKYECLGSRFRHSGKYEPGGAALYAWLQRVRFLAVQQEPKLPPFDENKLKEDLSDLLDSSCVEENMAKVPSFLKERGVCFLIVPHLQKTYLDGAMLYHHERPVIAMTIRHNRIDNFWFTLCHELGHLILKHSLNSGESVFLDNLDIRFDEQESQEYEANEFAKDKLLPIEAYEEFVHSSRSFSRKSIEIFAAKIKRHPGIVLGRLQYDGLVSYGHQRALLSKVESHLWPLIDVC